MLLKPTLDRIAEARDILGKLEAYYGKPQ